jgi:hypothetical protein
MRRLYTQQLTFFLNRIGSYCERYKGRRLAAFLPASYRSSVYIDSSHIIYTAKRSRFSKLRSSTCVAKLTILYPDEYLTALKIKHNFYQTTPNRVR